MMSNKILIFRNRAMSQLKEFNTLRNYVKMKKYLEQRAESKLDKQEFQRGNEGKVFKLKKVKKSNETLILPNSIENEQLVIFNSSNENFGKMNSFRSDSKFSIEKRKN